MNMIGLFLGIAMVLLCGFIEMEQVNKNPLKLNLQYNILVQKRHEQQDPQGTLMTCTY